MLDRTTSESSNN